jgi:hypothetical protein
MTDTTKPIKVQMTIRNGNPVFTLIAPADLPPGTYNATLELVEVEEDKQEWTLERHDSKTY